VNECARGQRTAPLLAKLVGRQWSLYKGIELNAISGQLSEAQLAARERVKRAQHVPHNKRNLDLGLSDLSQPAKRQYRAPQPSAALCSGSTYSVCKCHQMFHGSASILTDLTIQALSRAVVAALVANPDSHARVLQFHSASHTIPLSAHRISRRIAPL
jgi:hypothetical protein